MSAIQQISQYITFLLVIVSLVVLLVKINRSPCPGHQQSFKDVYGRVEALEKNHGENMAAIRELRTTIQNTNKLLEELRTDVKKLTEKLYSMGNER